MAEVLPFSLDERTSPAGVYADGQIVDVDGYVRIVCGKVVCFTDDVYNLSDEKDVEAVLLYGRKLYVDPMHPRDFGKDTVMTMRPWSVANTLSVRCTPVPVRFSCLPPVVRDNIRRFCDEYE